MSGIQFKMHQKIIHKFKKAGATSREKAVTFDEADLDLQEQYWLSYFAGTFLGRIKKTDDHRYYILECARFLNACSGLGVRIGRLRNFLRPESLFWILKTIEERN